MCWSLLIFWVIFGIAKYKKRIHKNLHSIDKLADCDDPYGIFAGMLITKEVLAKYDHNGVPPHELHLKVGDIALVLVTMSKADKITKNTRVLIRRITQRTVRAQTIIVMRKELVPM